MDSDLQNDLARSTTTSQVQSARMPTRPAGAVDGLLADKEALTAVLTYHVVPGRVMAADLAGMADDEGYITVKTVNGADLRLHVAGSKVHVGKGMANVVTADVSASNGVIHVIDAVLMP